jgi:hypothetical protein
MKNGFNRPILLMLFILAGMFLLSGCTEDNNLSSPSTKEIQLQQRIAELEKQLAEKQVDEGPKSAEGYSEEMERNKQLLAWYEDTLTKLTRTPKPEYEIINSTGIETVVFVKNAPSDYGARGIFLIRLALEFPEGEEVAFWRDLNAAKEYATNGTANEGEKQKHMLGQISQINGEYVLEQFGSTSGPAHIRFGKFKN